MYRIFFVILIWGGLLTSLRNARMDIVSKRFCISFFIVWAIAILGSFFNVERIGPVSTYTYILLLINVASFYLGFSMFRNNNNAMNLYDSMEGEIKSLSGNHVFRIVLVILCIYTYSLLIIYAGRVAALQNLGSLRAEYYEQNIYGPAYAILRPYVLSPFSYISMPIFGYLLLNDRKNITLYLTGFFLIGSLSLSGGRFGYFRLFMGVFFMMYVVNTSFRFSRKFIIYFFIVISIFFTVITYITSARQGFMKIGENLNARSDMVNAVSMYVTGPVAAFNYSVENNDIDLVGGLKYGRLSISPLEQFINNVFSRFGIHTLPALNAVAEVKQNRLIYFNGNAYNALYTAAYIFYLDFGFVGVLVLPFLIGYLFRRSIVLCYKTRSYWHFVLMFWCFIKSINSVFDYGFYDKTELFFIIIMLYVGNQYVTNHYGNSLN